MALILVRLKLAAGLNELPLAVTHAAYGCVIATSSDRSLPFSMVRTLPTFGQ
jgi:hypothetical protein